MHAPVSVQMTSVGCWRSVRTRLGTFHVAALDGAIVHSGLPNVPRERFEADLARRFPGIQFRERQADPVLERSALQLAEWCDGKRTAFELPLAPSGTPFQRKVWDALAAIPYGEVRSYAEVAQAIGKPGASRAVGQANHANPVAPFVPCHRVVAADGSLGGYGGGLSLKARMLEMEGVRIDATPRQATLG